MRRISDFPNVALRDEMLSEALRMKISDSDSATDEINSDRKEKSK